jgi:hypothetical protein
VRPPALSSARAGVATAVLAAILSGCGGSTTPTLTTEVSIRTPKGVRYSAELTARGTRECLIQNYGVIAARVKPFTRVARSCAQRSGSMRPLLIQVAKPATALILDRPPRGCGTVRITTGRGRSVPITESCSTTRPALRVVVLPRAATVVIEGIAGISRLALRHYRCAFICSRPL